MINLIRKFSAFAFTGTFSMILAACYGAPMDLQSQKRITVFDPENKPIEGLELTLKLRGDIKSVSTSDANGDIYLQLAQSDTASNFEVTISDIDGEANGGEFAAKDLKLTDEREILINMERK